MRIHFFFRDKTRVHMFYVLSKINQRLNNGQVYYVCRVSVLIVVLPAIRHGP